jgi:hypothetical protein
VILSVTVTVVSVPAGQLQVVVVVAVEVELVESALELRLEVLVGVTPELVLEPDVVFTTQLVLVIDVQETDVVLADVVETELWLVGATPELVLELDDVSTTQLVLVVDVQETDVVVADVVETELWLVDDADGMLEVVVGGPMSTDEVEVLELFRPVVHPDLEGCDHDQILDVEIEVLVPGLVEVESVVLEIVLSVSAVDVVLVEEAVVTGPSMVDEVEESVITTAEVVVVEEAEESVVTTAEVVVVEEADLDHDLLQVPLQLPLWFLLQELEPHRGGTSGPVVVVDMALEVVSEVMSDVLLVADVFGVTGPISVDDLRVVVTGPVLVVLVDEPGYEAWLEDLEDLELVDFEVDLEVARVVDTVGMSVVVLPEVDDVVTEMVVVEERVLLVVFVLVVDFLVVFFPPACNQSPHIPA